MFESARGMAQNCLPFASVFTLGRSTPFYASNCPLPILRRELCSAPESRVSSILRHNKPISHKRLSLRLISNASEEGGGDLTPRDDPPQTYTWWSSGWLGTFYQIEEATRIFLVALFWIFLFFGASAWDGTKSLRGGKRDSQHRR